MAGSGNQTEAERAFTRAYTRQMEEMQALERMEEMQTLEGATARIAMDEGEQDDEPSPPLSDEEPREETCSNETREPASADHFRYIIMKMLEAPASKEEIIAKLHGLLESHGAAMATQEPGEEIASPARERPPHAEAPDMEDSTFAPCSRRPSWNGRQPMGSQDFEKMARNSKGPNTRGEEPENNPKRKTKTHKRPTTGSELEDAIETIAAALGSAFKPPAPTEKRHEASRNQRGNWAPTKAQTPNQTTPWETTNPGGELWETTICESDQPQDSHSLPEAPTTMNPRVERQGRHLPSTRPPPGFPTHPETHQRRPGPAPTATAAPGLMSPGGPRLTTASPPPLLPFFSGDPAAQQQRPSSRQGHRPTRSESGPSPASLGRGRGLGLEAAAERSSPNELRQEMSFAHAQSLPAGRERNIEIGLHRLATSIPPPYCEFSHLKNHGQHHNVSNFSYNQVIPPADSHILKLDGTNFLEWNHQLQIVFLRENILFLVNDPPSKPWSFDVDCLHHRAYYWLMASLSPSIYPSIGPHLTVAEILEKIFDLFYSKNSTTISKISREFYSARHKSGTPMSEHILKLNATRADLIQRGENVSEDTMKSIIINSLDSSWDNFIMQLDSLSIGYIPLETFINRIVAEDTLRRDRSASRRESRPIKRVEFQTRSHNYPECFACGSRNHYKRDCPRNSRDRNHNQCRDRPGRRSESRDRYSPEGRFRRRDSPNPRDRRGQRDSSRDSQSGALCGLVGHQTTHARPGEGHKWLLDSGATNHSTYDRGILTSFKETEYHICIANQDKVLVTGKGNTDIKGIGKVEGVLLIPEIPYNILSTLKLSKELGIVITLIDGEVYMIKDNKHIGKIIIEGELIYLQPQEDCPPSTSSHDTEDQHVQDTAHKGRPYIGKPLHDDCAHLLHRKLGHASFPIVQKMAECSNGPRIKNCNIYLECSVCKCSKLKTKPKPKKASRTTNSTFQLVHMDLVGPLKPSIKYKKRYFLTIVDDFSRYGFIYTLNHKNEAFQKFKEFYKRTDTQHNIKIKQIMTDRGSEFLSRDFSNWLKEHGVLHFTSSPFSAFQNGVAERKQGVLQTMVRCVLEDAGLGQHFWAEALTYANYTLNRLWSSVVGKTPYEVMYNRKPQIAHLHVFGVTADVHIPKQLRRKGEKVSRRLRFMGYESGTKGYRFIDRDNKFIISRTAVFHENTNWSRIHLNEVFPRQEVTRGKDKPGTTETETHVKPNPKHQEVATKERKEDHPIIKVDALTEKEAKYMHDTETPPVRPIRQNRNKMPKRFEDYILTIHNNNTTPNSYEDILRLPREERTKWEEAMEKEMDSLRQLNVYTPSKVPDNKTPIGTKWVFKIKELEDNKTLYKARLVAQGFAQKYPEDYTDTYSPTVRAESVKSALVISTILGLEVHQFDVQTAYLHAELDKEIYVKAPPGKNTQKGDTWLLNKSLYGLKQSGKRWYECLARALRSMGFTATSADLCFFIKREGMDVEYVLIYVDDILYCGKHLQKCKDFADELGKHFALKSLGKINKYLGVQIDRTEKGFRLSQGEKILELLYKCNMKDAKPCETPMQIDFLKRMNEQGEAFKDNTLYRSIIGSLLYIANWTRPDITLAVNLLSRHVSEPRIFHWEGIKRLLRYLKYTMDACLLLEPDNSKEPKLTCYADADWAGDTKSRKSTSGYVFLINGSPVHWYTGKQNLVATSTAEAEYICLSKAANNLTWFDDLLSNIWTEPTHPITIHEDNKAAIDISMADAVGQRSRHIDIKHKHVRQLTNTGFIKAIHCETTEQIADILTKPLQNKQHAYLTSKLGVQTPYKHTTSSVRHLEGDLSHINA